ncbi:MAG: Hint domain-containing protein [Paracoccaceae bacterium]
MRVRIVQRRNATLEGRPKQGDNIFSEIRLDNTQRAVATWSVGATAAKVIRPAAFEIDALERVTQSSSRHAIGVGCISAASRVITSAGSQRVADIEIGDKILTRDNGFQSVRWIAKLTDRSALPSLIEISAGAIAEGKPDSNFIVSGNQRLLITGAQVSESFGASEVLVRAGDLLHLDGFQEMEDHSGFVALVFDQHEILRVNQSWLASLQPDHTCRSYLSEEQSGDLFRIFPRLKDLPIARSYPAARPLLSARFARQVRLNVC